jgi:hypothetical protein
MSHEIDLNHWMRISDAESTQGVFPYCPTHDPIAAWNNGGLRLQRQENSSQYYLALRVQEVRAWCIDPFPISLELNVVLSLHDGRDIGLGHFFIESEGVDFLALSHRPEMWLALRRPPTRTVLAILTRRFPGCACFFGPRAS